MIFKTARYGWLPDLPDHRDQLYGAPVELAAAPPAKVDLRPQCPLVYDQGQLGSCTANAIAAAIQFDRMKPYVIAKFRSKPPAKCYADALKYIVVLYQRVTPILSQLKGCLASGYPFVFGFTVYEGFESAQVARTGHASLPKSGEQVVGGHAVVGVGYDDTKQWLIVRNSWGARWGMKGYFTLPYAYVTDDNLANDFWTIRVVQ
jgi:C1A family cysteine protease